MTNISENEMKLVVESPTPVLLTTRESTLVTNEPNTTSHDLIERDIFATEQPRSQSVSMSFPRRDLAIQIPKDDSTVHCNKNFRTPTQFECLTE